MWALAPLISTGAAISAGADFFATSRIFLAGFLPLLVCISSFFTSKGYWKLTRFDIICGICSLGALCLWLMAQSPQLAILLAAIGDGVAALPTIKKAWQFPETETGLTYITSFVSVILIIPSIPVWNIENSAFQVYLLLSNTALLFAVYRKKVLRSYKI